MGKNLWKRPRGKDLKTSCRKSKPPKSLRSLPSQTLLLLHIITRPCSGSVCQGARMLHVTQNAHITGQAHIMIHILYTYTHAHLPILYYIQCALCIHPTHHWHVEHKHTPLCSIDIPTTYLSHTPTKYTHMFMPHFCYTTYTIHSQTHTSAYAQIQRFHKHTLFSN